jgi:hypothetical protein
MTREETFVRLLNLGIQVAEIEAALADPKAAIDRYEAAVLFLREYDGGLPTLDAAARPPAEAPRSEGRTRLECLKSTYGTSCIGPCVGSRWKGVGRKDPAHDWQNVPWPEDDLPPLGVVEDRTTAQLVADGDWRPKVGERVIATRNPKQDSLFMLWALDARASCSGTSGVVREEDDCDGLSFRVEHANGDFAWWAADELRPEE